MMMLQHALLYAKKGLAVFPCLPQAKEPATRNGCKDATTNLDTISRWWRQHPTFNVAIATGAISNIIAVDIDDLDAEAELRKLEAENTPLPSTIESITARGRHLLFRYPPQREVKNSASKIAPGIDVRGDGGNIIAPPSIHPTGWPYTWSVDTGNVFAATPAWLLDKITEPTRAKFAAPLDWVALIRDGLDEGNRNANITRLAGHLLRRHVDPEVVLELAFAFNQARCRPPLPPDDIMTIVDSIAMRELTRRGAK